MNNGFGIFCGGGGGGSKRDLELDSSCLERDGDPGRSWEGDFDL